MLEAAGLACVRGERTLFSDIGFALPRGGLLRVEGRNGSGKTSLLRVLCGLTPPARGRVEWQGQPIGALREEYARTLVYVGHLNALKGDLTAAENLRTAAALAGCTPSDERVRAGLERFGVHECAALPARVLSQGQRRRVALSLLLVRGQARLWLLDEPLAALDVEAAHVLEALIAEHLAGGGLAVLTTHQDVRIRAPIEQRIELGAC